VDPHQGFGRIDVAAVAKPQGGATLSLQQNRKVHTGQSRRTTVTITNSAAPLRVVLVYNDYPGASLVNNLNLVVTSPEGTVRVGNQADGAAATFDTTNNVEVVHIAQPAVGTWTIDVIGSNVPHGPQPYALVVKGGMP
jgi:serine protease AprX